MDIALVLAGGFVLLYLGAEALVRGGAAIALRLGIAPLVVGLTVVAFGTSAPEMVVSVGAALGGNAGIALGNVVGSNICNIALILGVAALIRPMAVQAQLIRLDVPIMIGASLLLVALTADAQLSRLDGALLLGVFAAYMGFLLAGARRSPPVLGGADTEAADTAAMPWWRGAALVVGGLFFLAAGGALFVEGAVTLGMRLGISERVVGLTVIAVGTSLPELATSVVAAVKNEGDLSIGNVVGSNIFNIMAILGATAMIQPIDTADFSSIDYGAMVGVALVLFPLAFTGHRLNRWEGGVLLAAYLGYTAFLFIR